MAYLCLGLERFDDENELSLEIKYNVMYVCMTGEGFTLLYQGTTWLFQLDLNFDPKPKSRNYLTSEQRYLNLDI